MLEKFLLVWFHFLRFVRGKKNLFFPHWILKMEITNTEIFLAYFGISMSLKRQTKSINSLSVLFIYEASFKFLTFMKFGVNLHVPNGRVLRMAVICITYIQLGVEVWGYSLIDWFHLTESSWMRISMYHKLAIIRGHVRRYIRNGIARYLTLGVFYPDPSCIRYWLNLWTPQTTAFFFCTCSLSVKWAWLIEQARGNRWSWDRHHWYSIAVYMLFSCLVEA